MLPADVALMPVRPPLAALVTAVAETWLHFRPFQCRISPRNGPANSEVVAPTAHALRADRAVTPSRKSPVFLAGCGFGLATRFQLWPFQCRISVLPELVLPSPTTQALLAEVAATLYKVAFDKGAETRCQLWPFQCTISAPEPARPTAQALLAEVAATASRPPPGAETRVQLWPFQCRARDDDPEKPTAQALLAEVAATAVRSPLTAATDGLAVTGRAPAASAAGLIQAAVAASDRTRAALERATSLGTEVLPPLATGPVPAGDSARSLQIGQAHSINGDSDTARWISYRAQGGGAQGGGAQGGGVPVRASWRSIMARS